MIPANNPRASEARQEMGRWRTQVETIEDRPYLDRAQQIAVLEDVNSLQAAIAEASQIRSWSCIVSRSQKTDSGLDSEDSAHSRSTLLRSSADTG